MLKLGKQNANQNLKEIFTKETRKIRITNSINKQSENKHKYTKHIIKPNWNCPKVILKETITNLKPTKVRNITQTTQDKKSLDKENHKKIK